MRTDILGGELGAAPRGAASCVRRWAAASERSVGSEESRAQGEQGDEARCYAVCGVERAAWVCSFHFSLGSSYTDHILSPSKFIISSHRII